MFSPFFGTSPCTSLRILRDEQWLSSLLDKEIPDGQGREESHRYFEFRNRTALSSTGILNTLLNASWIQESYIGKIPPLLLPSFVHQCDPSEQCCMCSEGFADNRDLAFLTCLTNNIHILCFGSEWVKASIWENPSEKPRAVSGRKHTMDSVRVWETYRVHGLVMLFGSSTTQTHRSSTLGILISVWETASLWAQCLQRVFTI